MILAIFISTFLCLFFILINLSSLAKKSSIRLRDSHEKSISRFGGVSVFAALLFTLHAKDNLDYKVVIYLTFYFFIGLYDDLVMPVNSKIKFGLILLGSIFFGAYLASDQFLPNNYTAYTVFLTLFYASIISSLVSGYNTSDGLNGLSAGLCICYLLSFFYISNFTNEFIIYIIPGLLGFLFLNFPLGKIFLGDCGAYLVGAYLSLVSICVAQSSSVSLIVLILLNFYPLADLSLSIFRRLKSKRTFTADSLHIHLVLFRYLQKKYLLKTKDANNLASLIILCVNFISSLFTSFYYKNIPVLTALIIFNIFLYLYFYKKFLSQIIYPRLNK